MARREASLMQLLRERKLSSLNSRQIAKLSVFAITVSCLVFVITSSLYLNPFGTNPNTDEYTYTAAAELILSGHVCAPYSFFAQPPSLKLCNLEHPPLVKVLMAGTIFLLGANLWGARLPSMIFGVFCIPLIAYISWRLTRKESIAIISAGLMASNPLLIGLSSIAMLDSAEIFFSLAAIALYLSGRFRNHSALKFAAIGCLMGLSILSKEVGIFTLLALVTYAFIESRLLAAAKRSLIMLATAAATVAVGFEIFDHYFTTFPNFINHIEFLVNFAKSIRNYYVSTNPNLWLTSLTPRDLGSGLGVLNPMISFPVFVWIPLLVLYIFSRKKSAGSLVLPAILFVWTYVPYFVIHDQFGRDVKYFYSIQMSPALVLGAAYLYSVIGERLVKKRKQEILTIAFVVCLTSFAILLLYWPPAGAISSSSSGGGQTTTSFFTPPMPYRLIQNNTGSIQVTHIPRFMETHMRYDKFPKEGNARHFATLTRTV